MSKAATAEKKWVFNEDSNSWSLVPEEFPESIVESKYGSAQEVENLFELGAISRKEYQEEFLKFSLLPHQSKHPDVFDEDFTTHEKKVVKTPVKETSSHPSSTKKDTKS